MNLSPIQSVPSFELTSAHQGQEAVTLAAEAFHAETRSAWPLLIGGCRRAGDGLMTIRSLGNRSESAHRHLTAYTDYTTGQILAELGQTDRLLILKKPFESDEVRSGCLTTTQMEQAR